MTADPREVIGLAAGRALVQAEDGDGYTDWGEWHACPDPPAGFECPRCGCAGVPFLAAPILDEIMQALAAAGYRLIIPARTILGVQIDDEPVVEVAPGLENAAPGIAQRWGGRTVQAVVGQWEPVPAAAPTG